MKVIWTKKKEQNFGNKLEVIVTSNMCYGLIRIQRNDLFT